MTLALVLGSTGCIGANLVRAALAAGWDVRAFHRPTSQTWMLEGLPVEHVTGDLADQASLVAAMEGCDIVFHAAAYYPRHSLDMAASVRHGVQEIRRVLDAASQARVGKLVYTSSLTTLGPPAEPHRLTNENDFYLPGSTRSAYFETKWAMEAEAWRAAAEGWPIIIVNPTAVFGPWDVKPTTGQILLQVARGRVPVWLDLELNVAQGQVLAAERGRIGRRYILGGENLSLHEALTIAAQEAGVRPPRWQVSLRLIEAGVRLGEIISHLPLIHPLPLEHLKTIREWRAIDITRARQELGFTSRPFVDTVRDTLAWFREHGYL